MDRWRKSTYSSSNGGNCAEVAAAPGAILVRDSKNPDGPRLTFGPDTWRPSPIASRSERRSGPLKIVRRFWSS
jgi:hypothetical protein